MLVAISQKSKKERTQLYIECDFELLRCSEKNNKWPGKHQVKIGSRSEFYCCTRSLISTTYVASPPIGSRVATKITSSDLMGLIRWFKWRYFLFSRKNLFLLVSWCADHTHKIFLQSKVLYFHPPSENYWEMFIGFCSTPKQCVAPGNIASKLGQDRNSTVTLTHSFRRHTVRGFTFSRKR